MIEEFDTKTNQKENSEHIEQELQIMLENLMKDENEASSTSTTRIGDKNPFVRLNERHHTVKNPLTNLGDGLNRQILFSRTGQKAHPCVRTDKRFPTQKIIQSNMFNFPKNNEYNSHGEDSLNNPSRNQSSKSLKIRPIDINIKKANYDQVQKNSFPQFISENLYFSFKGKFCYLIRNYNGSLLLQNTMGNTSYDIICNIFTEIKNEIPTLISDTYGNYFCQKLYLLLHEDQKFIFLNIVKNSILEISCNHVGNYPLQNIIENLKTDVEQNIIVDALKIENVFVRMIDDSNAIHIVEKIIANFDEEKISFVYDYIINNFLKLAVLQNGLGPAKKIILNSKNSSTKLRIQKILVKNFSYLIHDLYGNFTIQSALEGWDQFLIFPIIQSFFGNFANLSILKFSSNVVEKCFEVVGEGIVNIFMEELINTNKTLELILNNYGNYVLQKALNIASPNSKIVLINNILQNLSSLEDKRLIIKWKHICDSMMNSIINNNFSNKTENFDV